MSNKELADRLEQSADYLASQDQCTLLRAAASALRAGEWQTIDSAPRTGGAIWGFGDYPKEIDRWKRPALVMWRSDRWIEYRNGYEGGHDRLPWQPPTHWCRVVPPSTPTQEGEK